MTNETEKRARRLKAIAAWINEHCDGLRAEVEKGYCCTDSKIPGTRLRSPGKGRTGNQLIVRDLKMIKSKDVSAFDMRWNVIKDHNSSETYRTNSEVEEWLEEWCQKNPKRVAARS